MEVFSYWFKSKNTISVQTSIIRTCVKLLRTKLFSVLGEIP